MRNGQIHRQRRQRADKPQQISLAHACVNEHSAVAAFDQIAAGGEIVLDAPHARLDEADRELPLFILLLQPGENGAVGENPIPCVLARTGGIDPDAGGTVASGNPQRGHQTLRGKCRRAEAST